MSKLFLISMIFIATFNFSSSSPTTTVLPPTVTEISELSETTENPQIFIEEIPPQISSENLETPSVYTGPIYELILTVSGKFSDDLKNQKSKAFKKFSKDLDAELIYVIENAFGSEIKVGTFEVKNVLASNLEGFLYTSILVKVSEDEAEDWEKEIRNKIEKDGNLVEMEAKLWGFSWSEIKREDLWMYAEHAECMSDFCHNFVSSTSSPDPPQPPQSPSNPQSAPEDQQCTPRDEIQRGSTSIFIFDNEKCLNDIKNKFGTSPVDSSCAKPSLNEVRKTTKRSCEEFNKLNENSAIDGDDMAQASSGVDESAVRPDEEMTVVVVKKKGNKVFIEI